MGGGRLRERESTWRFDCALKYDLSNTKIYPKKNLFHPEMILRLSFCFKDTKKYRLINIKLFETI